MSQGGKQQLEKSIIEELYEYFSYPTSRGLVRHVVTNRDGPFAGGYREILPDRESCIVIKDTRTLLI